LSELRNSLKFLLAPEEVSFPIRFENFLSRYSGKLHKYSCLFHLSLPKPIDEVDQLPGYDISLTKNRPPEDDCSVEEKKFYLRDRQTVIATVTVNAVDIYSAKIECEQRIEALFAALKLYQATKIPQIKHDVSLVKQEGENDIFLETDNSRTQYIRDSKSPLAWISTEYK
jgi:hypothetical protein